MIESLTIEKPELWEGFLAEIPGSWLLQSWEWGTFQESVGNRVLRLAVPTGDGKLRAVASAILGRRPTARYLYVPHGPVVRPGDEEAFAGLTAQLIDIGRSEGVQYIRFEPRLPGPVARRWVARQRLIAGRREVQPRHEWLLDLGPGRSDADLLAGMRKTTRNLLRRADARGVDVTQHSDEASVRVFLRLLAETASRQRFRSQPDGYIQRQFEVLNRAGMAALLLARDTTGAVLAGAIVAFHGQTATYLHAASHSSRLPASRSVVWASIRSARDRGLRTYNLGGVAPDDRLSRRWHGLRLFKSGFGGQPVEWVGALDRPLGLRYGLVLGRDLQYQMSELFCPKCWPDADYCSVRHHIA